MEVPYVNGQNEWLDLNDTDYRWLALDSSYLPTCSDLWIDDISAFELTDGSYARVTLTGAAVTDGSVCDQLIDCDDPTFPALDGATAVSWLVLAREVTNDADSPLMAVWQTYHVPDGNDWTPVVSTAGIGRVISVVADLDGVGG